MNFEKAEKYRSKHPLGLRHKVGDQFGWFVIPDRNFGASLRIMVAPSKSEWQHISISLFHRCPTWAEMCSVKDLFFDPEDVVVQFHPKKSEYINMARHCLHLWKWNGGEFPTPPTICVGIN